MPIAMAARAPRLAVARGREVELWDYAHLRRLAIGASPYGAEILSLAVSADGNTVVAGDEDGHVIGFDSTMKRPERLTQHRDSVMAVDVSADGRLAASTSIDQSVMLTTPHSDLRSRPLTPPPAGEAPLQPSLAVSPDGRSLAVSAREGVQVWKLPTATTQGAPVGHPDPRTIEPGVGWSPDGRLLAAATQGVLSVWDARSHAEAGSFTHAFPQAPQFDGTEEARFMPDGRSVLINLPDGPAVVDYARHIVRQQLTAEDPGSGFAASADGRVMVMAEHARADGTVLSIWHWEGGTLHRVGRLTDTAMLRDLAVSQDGTEIAMADFDGRVVVHGLRDGRRTVLVSGLGDSHSSVAFSPDGSTVVQYESEHQLAVWDDTSGLLLGTWDYPDAGAAANNLAFGPDGSLLTIGADGAVMRWAVDATRWRAALCGMALTDLTNAEKDRYLQGTGITVHAMCPR
jgi:WD40 repeat protein